MFHKIYVKMVCNPKKKTENLFEMGLHKLSPQSLNIAHKLFAFDIGLEWIASGKLSSNMG